MDLDGVKCGGEIDFGDYDFSSLEQLTIRDAGLTSLKNFPSLPNLKTVRKKLMILLIVFYKIFFFSWIYAKIGYLRG